MSCLRKRAALLLILALALPAHAEDEAARTVTATIDLQRYDQPEAPVGPRLATPPDLIQMSEGFDDVSIWDVDRNREDGTWLPFGRPYLERAALSTDSVSSILHATLAHREVLAQTLSIDVADDLPLGLVLRGAPAAVAAARDALPWVLGGLAPSIEARAVLTVQLGDGPARLRATGSVRLWPGRWTRVYLHENEVPCVPAWDLEVAAESTIMDPVPVGVREGTELYLRLHPGETRSLIEVWAGDVAHLEMLEQDLTPVRNVPDGCGAATLSFPRSAVCRVFTHLLVPSGATRRSEVHWDDRGRRLRLVLDLGAAPRPSPDWLREGRNALAILRTGAVASGLEYETRPQRTDAWGERLQAQLYAAGEVAASEGKGFEFSLATVDGGGACFIEAPATALGPLRKTVAEAEARLVAYRVQVRSVAAPEAAFRKLLLEGTVGLGRSIPGEALIALNEAGAVAGEAMGSEALDDVPLGFRVGRSEPGVVDFSAELAQASAGLRPQVSARFAGVFGEVRVRSTGALTWVRVRGARCWADRDAGTVELAFRSPTTRKGKDEDPPPPAPSEPRVVSVPLLGGGQSAFDRELELSRDGADDVLLDVVVRGEEVLLFLVSVR